MHDLPLNYHELAASTATSRWAAPVQHAEAFGQRVAVYFVASPLQYLVARQLATTQEAGARQVLVWYQRAVEKIVRHEDWDAALYMPWPRFNPLPGFLGHHRRLCENIRQVASAVGGADRLHIHSAVFDTEAINYFLHALPRLCGARSVRARILPDGIINVRRYPLSRIKRLVMHLRNVRRLVSPELHYTAFAGDRIGSDAAFCDRVYVLPDLPHEYPSTKVVTLQPLAKPAVRSATAARAGRRALVIGQTLVANGLLSHEDLVEVTKRMRQWLALQDITHVAYKAHPKDAHLELAMEGDEQVQIDEPLEQWLTWHHFDAVIGVRSTALLFARQVYGSETTVRAFGWSQVRFKSAGERSSMERAFRSVGVEIEDFGQSAVGVAPLRNA